MSPSKKQKTVTFKLDENQNEMITSYQAESSWLPMFKTENVVIKFESQPVWLLGVTDKVTKHIVFPDFKSMYGLKSFIYKTSTQKQLYLNILNYLSKSIYISFGRSDLSPVIYLVSGSEHCWLDIIAKVKSMNRAVGIVESFWKPRRSLESDSKTIKHQWVGGATNFQTVYVTSSREIKPDYTSLRRSLGAFVNYKHRVLHQKTQGVKGYTEGDLVSLVELPLIIFLPMTYKREAMGQREVQGDELSHLVGLPSAFQINSSESLANIVPVQILDSLIKSVWSFSSLSRLSSSKRTQYTPTEFFVDPRGHYIPSLQQFLPHSWCNTHTNSTSAAKNDDAEVPIYLWNGRITPLFQAFKSISRTKQDSILATIRKFVLRIAIRHFVRDLFRVCGHRYGGGQQSKGT